MQEKQSSFPASSLGIIISDAIWTLHLWVVCWDVKAPCCSMFFGDRLQKIQSKFYHLNPFFSWHGICFPLCNRSQSQLPILWRSLRPHIRLQPALFARTLSHVSLRSLTSTQKLGPLSWSMHTHSLHTRLTRSRSLLILFCSNPPLESWTLPQTSIMTTCSSLKLMRFTLHWLPWDTRNSLSTYPRLGGPHGATRMKQGQPLRMQGNTTEIS